MKDEKVPAFYVNADGKKYGPYSNRTEDGVKDLLHLKGIKIEHV